MNPPFLRKKLLVLLFIPAISLAAGLGKMNVKSSLGEKLSADIELIDHQSGNAANIASTDDYTNNGVQVSDIPQGIHITQHKRADGSHYLHLSSDRPINDPFLELIIKLQTDTGQVLRQYTALIDPPISAAQAEPLTPEPAPAPIATGKTKKQVIIATDAEPAANLEEGVFEVDETPATPIKKAPRKDTVKKTTVAKAPAPKAAKKPTLEDDPGNAVAPSATAEPGAEYVVQPGDVFGKIAQKYQPVGVPLKKVMAELYKANPQAFMSNDMGRIIIGATLKIPTSEFILGGTDKKPPATPEETAAPTNTNNKQNALPGTTADDKYVVKVTKESGDEVVTTKKEVTETPAETAKTANGADALQAGEQKVPQPTVTGESTTPPPAEVAPAATPGTAQPAPTPPAPVAAKPPAAAIPAPASTTAKPSAETETGFLSGNALWMALGLMNMLFLGLIWFIFNRRESRLLRQQDELMRALRQYTELSRTKHDDADDIFVVTKPAAKTSTAANTQHTDNSAAHASQENKSASVLDEKQKLTNALVQTTQQAPISNQFDIDMFDIDPIVESEIYLSYGRDTQAESLLLDALEKTPNRSELYFALMKIYGERKEQAKFEHMEAILNRIEVDSEDIRHRNTETVQNLRQHYFVAPVQTEPSASAEEPATIEKSHAQSLLDEKVAEASPADTKTAELENGARFKELSSNDFVLEQETKDAATPPTIDKDIPLAFELPPLTKTDGAP